MIEGKIKRSQSLTTSEWSGGTTTELFIGPKNSCYADRDFDIRVSSAKVNVEESTFTALSGFDRHLMVLEGQLLIQHEGHHECLLNPFQTDFFLGDWTTQSRGVVTDFNLMLKRGLKGELDSVDLIKHRAAIIDCQYTQLVLFYCQKGEVQIDLYEKGDCLDSHILYEGDVYYFEKADHTVEVEINNALENETCKVIYCKVAV